MLKKIGVFVLEVIIIILNFAMAVLSMFRQDALAYLIFCGLAFCLVMNLQEDYKTIRQDSSEDK